MVFHITFMLALFHNEKCSNCINLFSCILCDLIVMCLVLSWWKLIKIVDLATCLMTGSRLSTCERSCKEHMWKLKSQNISRVTVTWLTREWPARCTDNWDFKCDSYTLHPYYIYPHYPQNWKEAIQKKTLEMFLQHPPC